jgi:Erv1 / Alr family/Thioredoxin
MMITRLCVFAAFSLVSRIAAHSYYSYPYLYRTEKDPNASLPVLDHVATDTDAPDFLYRPNPNSYRVTEFYVHWCDICRHFSTHYVKHARKMLLLVADRTPKVEITFHGISCVPNKALCQKQAVTGYPLIKLFKPGDMVGVTLRHMDAKPITMLKALDINVSGMPSENEDLEEENEQAGDESWWSSWYEYMQGIDLLDDSGNKARTRRTREDLRNDVHLSFDFAMRNNVYLTASDKLSDEAKNALSDYFVVLTNTLPPSWWQVHALLNELLRNIKYVTRKEPYLVKFLDKYPPESMAEGGDPIWSASCSHGEPGRGFTCGLWETFHAVTVGLVRYNRNQVVDQELMTTDFVAQTIRNFVEHFFTCDECRQHFLKMYDNCEFRRCDRLKKKTKLSGDHVSDLEWQQLPLWLYEIHNAVNVRLMHERADREKRAVGPQDEKDVRWPPMRDCHLCWLPTKGAATRKWNETVVFSYLELEYGQRDSSTSEFQRQLLEANLAAVDTNVQMLRSSRPSIAASTLFHPAMLLVCGYICFGARGYTLLRRAIFRKKERTV